MRPYRTIIVGWSVNLATEEGRQFAEEFERRLPEVLQALGQLGRGIFEHATTAHADLVNTFDAIGVTE